MELIGRACGVEPDCFAEYQPAAPPKRAPAEVGGRTTRPFGKALRGLKEARGLTYLELADRTPPATPDCRVRSGAAVSASRSGSRETAP